MDIFQLIFLIICTTIIKLNFITAKKELPSYIKKCSIKNPEILKTCLWENVEIVRPHLKLGIPEMGIPGLDPLVLEKVSMELPGFQAAFINSSVNEATNFELEDFILDLENTSLKIHLKFPKLHLFGDYEISGKLLVLQLSGNGFSSNNVSNLDAKAELHGVKQMKNGKTFILFKDNDLKLTIGDAKLHFGNLFGENEELTEAANRVVNENIQDFISELLPIVEQTVAAFIFPVVKHIFKTFSLEDLFLDYPKSSTN